MEALKKKIDLEYFYDTSSKIESISSGSIALDYALGNGGWPRGRISQLYGPQSAGKSTLALHLIANAQKQGEAALYIDGEYAFDPRYARALGVKVEQPYLILYQPTTAEEAFQIVDTFLRFEAVGVVVIDSIASLIPEARLKADYDQQDIGVLARFLSASLPKIVQLAKQSNAVILCINQVRDKISHGYGGGKTVPGGNALGFYSSVIAEIKRVDKVEDANKRVRAIRSRVTVVKNKASVPYGQAEFEIEFGKGISREKELLDLGLEHGIVTRKGPWYSMGDLKLGQGEAAAKKFFMDNPEIAQAVEKEIRNILDQQERVIGYGAGVTEQDDE